MLPSCSPSRLERRVFLVAMLTGSGPSLVRREKGHCIIKTGPPRLQMRRQDILTTLNRKRNRNSQTLPGTPPLACGLPGTSRSRSCHACGRSKEAGNLEQACAQGWAVLSLYCKTNGTCCMRQLISMILLLYLEEDSYFYFSFYHSVAAS